MRFRKKPQLASARVAFYAVTEDFSHPPRTVVKLDKSGALEDGTDPLALVIPLSAARHYSNAQDVPEFTGPFLTLLGDVVRELLNGKGPAEDFQLRESRTARHRTRPLASVATEQDLAEQMIIRGLPWVWKTAPGRAHRVVELKVVREGNRVWATIDAPTLGPLMFGGLAIFALVEYMARQLPFGEVVIPALAATAHVTQRLGARRTCPPDLLAAVDDEVLEIIRSPEAATQMREEIAAAGELSRGVHDSGGSHPSSEGEPDFTTQDPPSSIGEASTESSASADRAREFLFQARGRIEATGAAGDAAEAVTADATVDAYVRSESLIDEFVENEVDLASERQPAGRASSPPRFGEIFREEIEQTEARLGERWGTGTAHMAIGTVMAYGFAACAIRQRQLGDRGDSAFEPDPNVGTADIRRVWLERMTAEYERHAQDPELGPWIGQICSPGFSFFVRGAGTLGIVEARHSEGVEALTDELMVGAGMLDVATAYPGAGRVDSFLVFYALAGWSLYLANTPAWPLDATTSIPGAAHGPERELEVDALAQLENAITVSVYALGPYEARVLIDAEPLWPSFRYFLAVLEPGTPQPLVLVAAEQEEGAAEGGFRILMEGRATELEWIVGLEDVEAFQPRALQLARECLGISEEPVERAVDRRTDRGHQNGGGPPPVAGPQASGARLVARYRLGPYEAHLFTDIETELGDIAYRHILATFDQTGEPRLFVAAEQGPGGSDVLGVFGEEGHGSYPWDASWEDLERFAAHALKLSAELLRVTEEPERLVDEP